MSKSTLILGGARSGKSSYAQSLAEESGKSVTFLATAQALDEEMSVRIQKHRAERPADWETLEVPLAVASHTQQIKSDVVILDCITLLISNLLMQFVKDDLVDEAQFKLAVEQEVNELIAVIREQEQDWIIISNEVGLGLVSPYQMGRVYRDWLGEPTSGARSRSSHLDGGWNPDDRQRMKDIYGHSNPSNGLTKYPSSGSVQP